MEFTVVPSPDAITHDEFTTALDEYPRLIDSMSNNSKRPAKYSQKTLQQLVEYRYTQAPAAFSPTAASPQEMTLEDVRCLVEWKLRHGKFRPMLLGLAGSNNPKLARRTIAAAIRNYRASSDVDAALAALAKLRGIGPATASLLLSVHDPERVIFFSDEAFLWLCGDSLRERGTSKKAQRKKKQMTIKYNKEEYAMLRRNMENLTKRLGVGATDVEKVAYVLMKRQAAADAEKAAEAAKEAAEAAKQAAEAAEKEGEEEDEEEEDEEEEDEEEEEGTLKLAKDKKPVKSTKKSKDAELPRQISKSKETPPKRKTVPAEEETAASTKRAKRAKK
ncbi:hypothetical protein ISF_09388 [Cordyceps fumosorosea ARSEF 2679]|uniref:Uncharacterized protein n=1 Tax=Cordyceps fumosorosea (strain ARSEF 2679) TaxID=1081104 RepID=A0A167J1C4_CORFA|nr:hypothetical protein ISF_09388 [Cordyceps fumosorosea ARSEF 2679]OAA49685.1 hypothetical protein ISF_09388 [Cordyceps fumosorosea ARSEF 2679]